MNRELFNEFKSRNNLTVIKVGRLEWLGHVVRAGGTRTDRSYPKADQEEGQEEEEHLD